MGDTGCKCAGGSGRLAHTRAPAEWDDIITSLSKFRGIHSACMRNDAARQTRGASDKRTETVTGFRLIPEQFATRPPASVFESTRTTSASVVGFRRKCQRRCWLSRHAVVPRPVHVVPRSPVSSSRACTSPEEMKNTSLHLSARSMPYDPELGS